jgi:integrase
VRSKESTFKQLAEEAGATIHGSKRRSKRIGLKRLPDDWRERIVDRAYETNSKYADAIAVSALAGCRPRELTLGVRVTLSQDGRQLTLHIKNAKPQGKAHDGERRLAFDATDPIAKRIVNQARTAGGSLVIGIAHGAEDPENAFVQAVKRISASAKATGAAKYTVTPYSFRHQFAADLKADGWDEERIALAAGHSSEYTQSMYGSVHQGRTRQVRLKDVSSDRKVTRTKVPALAELKAKASSRASVKRKAR